MSNPAFSIIVPTYQRRDVVCDAVQAISKIAYDGPLELIVIVDGSTDGTAAALATIMCPFPVRIIEQANAGAASARNAGAALATGDVLLFLDDDMICAPDIVRQHAATHAQGADAVLGYVPLSADSPAGFLSEGIDVWTREVFAEASQHAPIDAFQVFSGQISVRADVFRELAGFDESFTSAGHFANEDADFGVRLLARYQVRFNAQAVSHHRYVVTPQHNMQKAFDAARADVRFARKHPDLAYDLFHLRGADKRMSRYVYRPLAAVPFAGRIAAWIGVMLARLVLASPWRSSRSLARLYYAARNVAYWSQVRASGGLPKGKPVLILCYHLVDGRADDPVLGDYAITRATFARHVTSLRQRGFQFVSPDDLGEFLHGEKQMPAKAVLLTFDDCYTELLDTAETALHPHGISALAFAVSGMGSNSNEWDQAAGSGKVQLLDAQGLKQLAGLGCEIGSHSRSHSEMPMLDDAQLLSETAGAADDLEHAGLPRPRFFAYPYGARDARSIAAARAAGYDAAFGLSHKRATRMSNPFDLPRVTIDARHIGWRFWAKTAWPRLTARL